MAPVPSSRLRVPAEWMAAAALLLCGCGGIGVTLGASSFAGEAGADAGAVPSDRDAGDAGTGKGFDQITVDGGVGAYEAAAPSLYTGSPLCMNLTASPKCDPDLPACISGAYDGGPNLCTSEVSLCGADSGTANMPAACRVGSTSPVCVLGPNYNEQATQGASCSNSSECGVGFECVGDSKQGTCKHYCCDPTTCDSASHTGYGATRPFCDIENVVGGLELVPVCTLAPKCVPLEPDACADAGPDMTCTVVNAETAQAACVKIGAGAEGQDCTRQKCGADLACVSGTCRQLCKPGGVCSPGQTCTPPSAYRTLGGIGLCQ